jgi:hypothetical protein
MDHNHTTAEGLATWIERRQHTPVELRQVLHYALKDAEARGEERGERCPDCGTSGMLCVPCSMASAPIGSFDSVAIPPDPAPEPAAPLNAHVGRRVPVVQVGAYFTIDSADRGRTVGVAENMATANAHVAAGNAEELAEEIDLSGLYFYGGEKR